jgi:hypothetical protein
MKTEAIVPFLACTAHHTRPSLRHAEPNKCNLYSLGISPINAEIVEKSLIEYPLADKKKELISGLKFGFKLQYSGTRLPIR